jgi:hypothetical protein
MAGKILFPNFLSLSQEQKQIHTYSTYENKCNVVIVNERDSVNLDDRGR